MLRMALPGSEGPSREGRLPCASPELRAPLSWRGDEATSERTGSSVQLCGPASLRQFREATLEPSRGCSWRKAGAQCPATLSHVEGGGLGGGRVGLSWNKQPPNLNLGASAQQKLFFSLTPPSQSSAPQSHSGLQARRSSPAGSSPGGFLGHRDRGRHNREVSVQPGGDPRHFKSRPVGQRQSEGARAGDTDRSLGMTILDTSDNEDPSRGPRTWGPRALRLNLSESQSLGWWNRDRVVSASLGWSGELRSRASKALPATRGPQTAVHCVWVLLPSLTATVISENCQNILLHLLLFYKNESENARAEP